VAEESGVVWLNCHPQEAEIIVPDWKTLLVRDGLRYGLRLDPRQREHREQFCRLLFKGQIEPDSLCSNGKRFLGKEEWTPEVEKLRDQLRESRAQFAEWREACRQAEADIAAIESQVAANDELAKVSQLYKLREQKMTECQLARIKRDTAERQVRSRLETFSKAVEEARRRQFERLKRPLDQAAAQFNEELMSAYLRFRKAFDDAVPKIRDVRPTFLDTVDYDTVAISNYEGGKIKTLRAVPQVRVQENRFVFTLKEVG
jgi:hypothetical protein